MWRRSPLVLVLTLCAVQGTAQAVEVDALKQRYLDCTRESSPRRIPGTEAEACAEVGERLLNAGFGGDAQRLRAWAQDARDTDLFKDTHAQYEAGHYADAYARFARLADCGHREAARIALQMRQFGPRLYGARFHAGPQQLGRWRSLLAGEAGRADDPGCAAPTAPGGAMAPPPAMAPRVPAVPAELPEEHWRHHGVG
jgi:hypothetical protein